MTSDGAGKGPQGQAVTILRKLLGSLELEIMELMWQMEAATVQQVAEAINRERPIAYTTVMTVMGHLVDKGLLARTKEGKRFRYQVARDRAEFLREASRSMIRSLVDDFGDLAIAQFLGEISKLDTNRLERLRNLGQQTSNEGHISD